MKVADLLETWPELEEALIAQAPTFRSLRNPVLRRTVARVATLEQAAGVGGIPVRDLVAALRRAAGLPDAGDAAADIPGTREAPGWVDPSKVVARVNAEALLDAGRVPLGIVNQKARNLAPGEILIVESTFPPLPLVDALEKQGYETFVREGSPGRFETYVVRRVPDGER